MEFNSVEEIKEYFGVSMDNEIELRKELVLLLSKLHPDKTGGEYQSKKQQGDYEELDQAIKFLDENSTDVMVTRKEWNGMVQKVDELLVQKIRNEELVENEYSSQLAKVIEVSITSFSKRHLAPKITSVAVAVVLTALWSFPSLIEKNSNIKKIINPESIWFSLIWIIGLLVVSVFWTYIRMKEKKDEVMKKRYSLESTQNEIFKFFLAWLRSFNPSSIDFKTIEPRKYAHVYKFSKDDLMNFLLNYYEMFSQEFKISLGEDITSLSRKIDNRFSKEQMEAISSIKRDDFNSGFLYVVPGKLDLDLAQNICNTLVTKLISKGIITLAERRILSDMYVYTEEH